MYTVNLKKLKKRAPGRLVFPVQGRATQHQRVLANREARRKKLERLRARQQRTPHQKVEP